MSAPDAIGAKDAHVLTINSNPLDDTPQCCSERTKLVLETVGKILIAVGAVGTGAFYAAPVAAPAAAAAMVGTCAFGCTARRRSESELETGSRKEFIGSLLFGIICGGAAGAATGYFAWDYVVNYVYSPKIVSFAAIPGAALIGVGGLLWSISCCRKKST